MPLKPSLLSRQTGAQPVTEPFAKPALIDQTLDQPLDQLLGKPLVKPLVKGWCPGALRPMLSGDGLVVRIRPPAGRLSQVQAAAIADLATRYGNGLIDLTNRANLQLRGVTPAALEGLTAGLRDLALIDASAEIEARRNIVVTPFWHAGDGTQSLAAELAKALAQADAPALPSKFGFAVDTGEQLVLQSCSADIRIERHANRLYVRAEGSSHSTHVTLEQAVPTAIALARLSIAHQATADCSQPQDRSARYAAKPLIAAELAAEIAADLPATLQAQLATQTDAAQIAIGANPHGWLVGIALGQMTAQTLAKLAALAATAAGNSSGGLRLTPWRMLLIEGLGEPPQAPGLITQAEDPLLRVVACSGAPACLQAHTDTRALARQLAPWLPLHSKLHISGCSKGCAQQQPGLTLVATAAGIDLIRHGNAAATADLLALPTHLVLEELQRLLHATPV